VLTTRRAAATYRAIAVPIGWVVAGGLLLGSGFVRWIADGPGSRFGGLELADNLRNGVLSPSWGVWVTVSVYSIVGIGGLLVASAGLGQVAIVVARGALCCVALVLFVVLGAFVLPFGEWGAGPTMATIAFAMGAALTAVQLVVTLRPRT